MSVTNNSPDNRQELNSTIIATSDGVLNDISIVTGQVGNIPVTTGEVLPLPTFTGEVLPFNNIDSNLTFEITETDVDSNRDVNFKVYKKSVPIFDKTLEDFVLNTREIVGLPLDEDITKAQLQQAIDWDTKADVTALNAEILARQSADSVLQSNINTEASTRENADTALGGRITTEETTRANADTVITNALTSHTSNTNNPHSVTKTQVGLGNVENKPLDTVPQEHSDNYITSGGVYEFVGSHGGKIDHIQKNGTELPIVNKTVNIPVPTKTSDITNDSGYITSDYHDPTKQNVINTGNKLPYEYISNQPHIPTTTGELTNDAGFITKEVDNLTNYYTSTQTDTKISEHHDTTKQDKLTNQTVYENKGTAYKVPQITTNNLGQVTSITEVDIAKTTLTDLGITATALELSYSSGVTSNIQTLLNSKEPADATILKKANVVDNVTSTATDLPLSANQGKVLQTEIDNLKSLGRFLAVLNCSNGTVSSLPSGSVGDTYAYKVGDYYRVGANGTYAPKPTATYTIDSTSGSSNFELGSVTYKSGDVIYCSNLTETTSTWVKQEGSGEGKVQDVQVNGTSVLSGGIANITDVPSTIVSGTLTDNQIASASTWNAKSVVSVSSTGTATDKVEYITVDGVEKKIGADDPTEYTTKLQEDLYTYVNIGKITGASQTNPVKVADAGDPLKEVFNSILGTEVDVNPTINQGGTTFTKTEQTGTTSVSGAEIGQSISALTGTVTFTVTNTATCSYGLKAGSYDTYSKTTATTFNYPIKTRTITSSETTYNYQVRIKYPALNGCTLSVTAGTLVWNDTTNNYLYCNVDANNKVTVSIAIPANTSTASAITRFGQLEADVDFDPATYQETVVDNFWTYLKASYTATGKTHTAISEVKSTAYTITAGTRYAYSKVTSSTTTPTSSLTKQAAESTFGTSGADFSYNLGDYIYLYRTTSGKTVLTYVLGQWASVTFAELSATTITLDNGATCTYYPYRVGPMEATGSAKYRV